MARNLLAVSDLELFVHYLDSRNIAHRPGRGHYEVLQVRHNSGQWHCVYRRDATNAGGPLQHYTVDRRMERLVMNFIKEKHRVQRQEDPHIGLGCNPGTPPEQ